MSERLQNRLLTALRLALYVFFVALTIIGQRTPGWMYLVLEFIGLVGVVAVIWRYNARNQ